MDRTLAKYAVKTADVRNFPGLAPVWNERMRNPRARLARFTAWSTCWANVNLLSVIMPKSRIWSTCSKTVPPLFIYSGASYVISDLDGGRLRVRVNDLHFDGFSERPQKADQAVRRSRSHWSSWLSDGYVILRNILTSSACIRQPELTVEERSLIKREKRRGAKRDPSGTPEITSCQCEVLPFPITFWRLSDDRYETNKFKCNAMFFSSIKGTNPALKKPSNIPEIYAKMFGRFH